MKESAYVYILTTKRNTVLYTGVTNSLERRMSEHELGTSNGFAAKYHAHKLVYAQPFDSIREAIAWEKRLKSGSRAKKVELIERGNPDWKNLWRKKEIQPR